MKTSIALSAILVSIVFTSCKKEHICKCETETTESYSNGTIGDDTSEPFPVVQPSVTKSTNYITFKATKKNAEIKCAASEAEEFRGDSWYTISTKTTCELQ